MISLHRQRGLAMSKMRGLHAHLTSFLPSTVCLVLASAAYDPNDYIEEENERHFTTGLPL